MPVLFVGHGSPMNAIEDNQWSRGFRALATLVPRPKTILAISAHWYVPATAVTADEYPKTIHDFGGFPEPLYKIDYPASGNPVLAGQLVTRLDRFQAFASNDWGIDHGTWSILLHMYPAADIPVVQLSINRSLTPADHIAIGQLLAPLRDDGILIMGSGNITHNLRHAMQSAYSGETATPSWARDFDLAVAHAVERHDLDFLATALQSADGRQSHPTPDHFLPLLYAAGAGVASDPVRFPLVGFDLASLSMRSLIIG